MKQTYIYAPDSSSSKQRVFANIIMLRIVKIESVFVFSERSILFLKFACVASSCFGTSFIGKKGDKII